MEPFVKLPVRQLVEFVLKGGSIDNGVLLDSAPYAVLLTMAAAGGAAMFLRRRSQRS